MKYSVPVYFAGISILLFLTASALQDGNKQPEKPNNTKQSGICTFCINSKHSPKEDFYHFANGAWLSNNPVPDTESAWGSFTVLRDKNEHLLREILEETATKRNIKGSIRQKVGDFFLMAMDTAKLESDGTSPLMEDLNRIAAIEKTNQLPAITADFHSKGAGVFFNFYVRQDAKNSEKYITYISQGGLGLPDRDYYFKQDEKSKSIRESYKRTIQKIFAAMGEKNTSQKADAVIKIETALAEASMERTMLRNMELLYNKMSFADLKKMAPAFDWDAYIKSLGMKPIDELIVTQPDFVTAFNQILSTAKLEDIKSYYAWNLARNAAPRLNRTMEEISFNFYGTILSGTKTMKPRWQKALTATNENLGEALGQLYVAKAFSPQAKEKVNQMVDNLTLAFAERIRNLDWMSDSTKAKAMEKLEAFERKLGYPDKWKDYSSLEIEKVSYLDNVYRARKFEHKRMINKIGQEVDRDEWGMSPQTVNAYYSSSKNEIVFPAAIMQPPFFNEEADDAANYGGMGAVIGHELTHGFDDQGSKYDAKGNLNNWWTAQDREKFNALTKKLVEQFNNYEALEGLNVNGQLTLGENIADLGGLSIAYYAYKKSLNGQEGPVIDGYTADQRFFLGWAQVWKINMTNEYLRNMIMTNPHSPGQFRVLGPLSNMPEFYQAFGVEPGNGMYKNELERAKIW